MVSLRSDDHTGKPGYDSSKNAHLLFSSIAKNAPFVQQPFHQTLLGKIPPELREKIFIELLAAPPSYAGHDFASNFTGAKDSISFVHLKASSLEVTLTCRQIYLEARQVFFASKAYYLDNPHEAKQFIEYRTSPIFRHDTVTALCLEGLVTYHSRYTKKQIDQICSDPIAYRGFRSTREQLEAKKTQNLNPRGCEFFLSAGFDNLKKVSLCMRVGEEMAYLSFLYGLTGLQKGLVEFLNASKWLIRPQHAEHVWRIQYACFSGAAYGIDKNGELIDWNVLQIEKETTNIDSRATGLKDGDERYVEVEIQRTARSPLLISNGQDSHGMLDEELSNITIC